MLIASPSLLICKQQLLEKVNHDIRDYAGLGGLLKKSE